MAVNLSFIGGAGWQFFDDNGDPLSGGKIYTYVAGTTTPLVTYTSRSGTIPNTNPIILDAAGRTPEQIWSTEGVLYKYVVLRSDNTLVRTWDNIGGSTVASDLGIDLSDTTSNAKGDALVGFRQSNSAGFLPGAVASTVNNKLQEIVSVKDFGAVGDGANDDTAAIQSAIDYLTGNAGGTLYIPPGLYKITATLNVGLPILTNYTFLTTRTTEINDATYEANKIQSNILANRTKSHIDFEFAAGATFVASWSPTVPTPVLAYNLNEATRIGSGSINNASIVSSVMVPNGVYNLDAVLTPQSNNLIAIFAAAECRRISQAFISGIEHGIISFRGFWTRITDIYMWRGAGVCLNVVAGNAMKVDNLSLWYSGVGLAFDGGASEIRGIHTEQVARDIVIYQADTSVFGPAYLEDVETTSGAGTYAVTLGYVGNAQNITHCCFDNIRVGSTRPGKGAYRIWDTFNTAFNGCRAYNQTVTFSSASNGLLNNCDFSSDASNRSNFQVFRSGNSQFASSAPPGTEYVTQGPWMFRVVVTAVGSIAPNAVGLFDFALPANLNTTNQLTAHFTWASGGDDRLVTSTRVLFVTPRVVQLAFYNSTASPINIDGAIAYLAVFATL